MPIPCLGACLEGQKGAASVEGENMIFDTNNNLALYVPLIPGLKKVSTPHSELTPPYAGHSPNI
jgi:hypothetical protein